MDCRAKIEKILNEKFQPLKLTVRDDSAQHAGHAEAAQSGGGHYSVEIISEKFRSIPKLQRHRMIYDCLFPQLKKDIHALTIKAGTP